jgi:hypothetical protein
MDRGKEKSYNVQINQPTATSFKQYRTKSISSLSIDVYWIHLGLIIIGSLYLKRERTALKSVMFNMIGDSL